MLKTWLIDSKILQSDFADRCKVSRGYMSGLVNGDKKPSLELAVRIEIFTNDAVPSRSWFTESELHKMRLNSALEKAANLSSMQEAG